MADSRPSQSGSDNTNNETNFETVVSLLRRAESLLSSRLSGNNISGGAETNTGGSNPETVSSSERSDRSLANFRTLFARYNNTGGGSRSSFPAPSLGQARAGPPAKRKKFGPFITKETWTHDFFCLADHRQSHKPSRGDKFLLQDAGLGRKTVVFNRKDGALAFVEKIESVYPKLKDAGGFELLRSGPSSKDLIVINPPASGYTVPFLKEVSGLGQALAYIRPLQRSLTLEPVQPLFKDLPGTSTECPRVQCISCKVQLPVTGVREHQMVCPERRTTANAIPTGSEACENEDDEGWSGQPAEQSGAIQDQSQCPSPSTTQYTTPTDEDPSIAALSELCPDASSEQILQSLNRNRGDVNLAAQELLGLSQDSFSHGDETRDDDAELLTPVFLSKSTPEKMKLLSTPEDALEAFQQACVQTNSPRELFMVNRMDGSEELKRDLLGLYKDPKKNLKARPKVRFEGEEGVGVGPIREFFVCALKIPQEGIHGEGRPIAFFEGERDHLLPIHNQVVQQMGAFTCIGRIIGHSILHGGPGLHGLSPVAKHYWSHEDLASNPPPIELEDIPDYNLREAVQELQHLTSGETVSSQLRESLFPYMMEAGLEPELLCGGRDVLAQGLLWFFVVDKRKRELDDIAEGMNAVSLQRFLIKQTSLLKIAFPSHAEIQISASERLAKVTYVDKIRDKDEQAREFFERYVSEMNERNGGGPRLNDLCSFWSGWDVLPPRKEVLTVKFNSDERSKSPMSETCFLSLILPLGHNTYEEFRKAMDAAVQYGSKGFSFA